MIAFIRQIRDELMPTEDTVCLQRACLITEAYQMYKNDPIPIKRLLKVKKLIFSSKKIIFTLTT
jgi:pyruvate-formate lyase